MAVTPYNFCYLVGNQNVVNILFLSMIDTEHQALFQNLRKEFIDGAMIEMFDNKYKN